MSYLTASNSANAERNSDVTGPDPIVGGPPNFIDGSADIKGQGTIKALITNRNTNKIYEVTGFAKAVDQASECRVLPLFYFLNFLTKSDIAGAVDKVTGTAAISGEGQVTVVFSNENKQYQLAGVAKLADSPVQELDQKFFVTSRGGEYFFVPSIPMVKELANE